MTSWRGERTKQEGPEWERDEEGEGGTVVRQGESRLSVVPQCVSQAQDLEMG